MGAVVEFAQFIMAIAATTVVTSVMKVRARELMVKTDPL